MILFLRFKEMEQFISYYPLKQGLKHIFRLQSLQWFIDLYPTIH